MLAVTGATGQVGGRVAARLAELGRKQRLIVRDPARAPDLPDAEVVPASSYGDAVAMGRALSGVDTLFLVSAQDRMGAVQRSAAEKAPNPTYDRTTQQVTAVDAAAAAGVRHIIYLSFLNAAADSTFVLARDHFHTEEHIRALGMPFTFLRMSLYTENVPLHVSDGGVIRAPAGEGRACWLTRDDLADVAVAVMTGSGHEGCTYDVTGPEALTMVETAERLSYATGRKITYQAQTPHQARTTHTTSGLDKFEAEQIRLTGSGLDDYGVEVWVSHFLQIATGELDTVSDTVPKLAGHLAQSLAEYLEKHPESYRHLLAS
ncbi:MAG TPA: SDR family oxidoreductase [Dehalococcoidia bacterium]|nr:SDR family oxidoreductase [Dehalococcoidia bacterium]